MKKNNIGDKKKNTKKSQLSSSESNKKSTIIKSQIDWEKEFEIPSYDEYRIKDSLMEYDDEDIETKMIRLVFLKKKGENIKDKISIKKKLRPTRGDNLSRLQKIRLAVSMLEKLKLKKKKKILFKYLKGKKITLGLKIASNFFNKIKKYIMKVYMKKVFNFVFPNVKKENQRDSIISKNKNKSIFIFSPQYSNKKLKKFKFPTKPLKLELLTKKTHMNKKRGVENILERIEKEKEKEKILGEKLRKLSNLKKREKEYISRIDQKKKKIRQEIELYKKNNNISDDDISQIKQINNISDGGSSFFSNDNSSKFGTLNLNNSVKTDEILKLPRKKGKKLNKELKLSQIVKGTKKYKKDEDSEIYSFNKKKLNTSENSKEDFFLRNSVKNVRSKKKFEMTGSKKSKIRMRLSSINFKNNFTKVLNNQNNNNTKLPEKKISNFSNNKENILL